jgi:glycosyltransferase involved in cell wall biosynthesis
MEEATVAVVVTTYNDADFLREALSSIFHQTKPAHEVIVVDDGSDVVPDSIVAEFPLARLLRKPNGGLASARNVGLDAASSAFITFLDADDRYRPNALAAGLDCYARSPNAAMVYGGHARIRREGSQIGAEIYRPISPDPYADFLTGNLIGMHATVLYRRNALLSLGGFDANLRRCEDYDVYLRLAQKLPVASHPQIIAEYRWHGGNMSRDTSKMLEAVLLVHDRHRGQMGERQKAWHKGRRNWELWYKKGQRENWEGEQGGEERHRSTPGDGAMKGLKERLRNGRLHRLVARARGTWPPPLGAVRFGHLAGTRPVSQDFGWDRGTPVDRYYIEQFLGARAADIRGRALEIADDAYCSRFGGRQIAQQDILHLHPGSSRATIVGDLTKPGVLPDNTFDCIVLTQTLHFIFDLHEAAERLHSALRPGGVLLLTVPGISPVDRGEWAANWLWSFTSTSLRKLFEPCFGTEALQVHAHGNVFSATAFLHGVALEEIDTSKLAINDPAYPVIVTLRAERLPVEGSSFF